MVNDLGALVGGALGWGVTGALSDAARQGVLMVTGEQSKFSWEELGQSAELSAITGGLKEELEVNVFPHAPNTTLGGDTPIPRSVFSSYGLTLLENETIAVGKNLVLMATGQEKRFAWKDLINTAGQSILNVTVDNALGVTNNEPNLLAALLNTELGAVISSAVYKNTIDPWQAAGEAFGMTAGQTLIASQRVYVHKKEIAQQKKRDQEAFKQDIASSMEIAFNEALQEMDMDPTFLAGKYFTGNVSNNKKPSVGFWGQPLDGLKHRPSKSDQQRKKQHNGVIDQASQQAHQHHDTDLSYAQYVQQNSVEGMWQQRMSQSSSTHNKSALSSTLDVLENALVGLPLGGPQTSESRAAAQKIAMGVVLGVGDFVNDMSNLGLYALYVAGHPDVLFSDIGNAFNSYWGNAVAVMQDPKTALKNDFDDYQSFANLDLQSQTRLETSFALGFFGRVGEIGKVAEAGLVGEKNLSRMEYLTQKYGTMTSPERMARIDELAEKNFQKRLNESINSEKTVYRYLSHEGLQKSLETGYVRGYATTLFSHSSREVSQGAQILSEWGTPEYGVAIPTDKLTGFRLARPFGNTSKIGWEPYTNSYPMGGPGHWPQFLIDPVPVDNVYIYKLKP